MIMNNETIRDYLREKFGAEPLAGLARIELTALLDGRWEVVLTTVKARGVGIGKTPTEAALAAAAAANIKRKSVRQAEDAA